MESFKKLTTICFLPTEKVDKKKLDQVENILLTHKNLDLDQGIESFENSTVLILACVTGNIDLIQLLMEFGASVNIQNEHGISALFNAVKYDHLDVVKFLLEYGADPNVQESERKDTPLICASKYGRVEIVHYLLASGATPNTMNKYHQSALSSCLVCFIFKEGIDKKKYKLVAKLLCKYGTNLKLICKVPFNYQRFYTSRVKQQGFGTIYEIARDEKIQDMLDKYTPDECLPQVAMSAKKKKKKQQQKPNKAQRIPAPIRRIKCAREHKKQVAMKSLCNKQMDEKKKDSAHLFCHCNKHCFAFTETLTNGCQRMVLKCAQKRKCNYLVISCDKCGEFHEKRKCSAWDQKCSGCNKIGHFIKQCAKYNKSLI